ncbi:polysaccharide pyruvyl transferase family protein [Paramicrobacterium agarici]|nr:polysaccharide pyruvyl transferase family protein [Microbacterium agarici]
MGNDASGAAMIELVRAVAPDCEITAISPAPDRATVSLGIPALPIRSSHQSAARHFFSKVRNKLLDLANLVSIVSHFDTVIVPGTGLLERVAGRLPGGDQTWLLLLSIACQMKRVPLAWFALGGSDALPAMQRLTAVAASRFPHYRSYRDQATASSIGARARTDRVVPDVVFSSSFDVLSSPDSTGVVGLSVINYEPEDPQARERYLEVLADVAQEISASGRRVRFLLGDRADAGPTEWVCGHAMSSSSGDLDPALPFGAFADMVAAVAECDVVIASRYHVIVASALAATPIVALAHAHKDVALMEQLGLTETVLHAETITSQKVLELVERCSASRSEIRHRLVERTNAFRATALREFSQSGITSIQGRVST